MRAELTDERRVVIRFVGTGILIGQGKDVAGGIGTIPVPSGMPSTGAALSPRMMEPADELTPPPAHAGSRVILSDVG